MLRRPIQRRHWIAVFYLLMSLSTFDSYLMHSRVARSLGTFQHSLLPKKKKHELQHSTGFPWYCQNVSKYSMHRLHFSEKITKCFWAIIDICHCFKHSKRTVMANQLSSSCPSESSSWSSESSLPMTGDGGDYTGARQNTGVVIA